MPRSRSVALAFLLVVAEACGAAPPTTAAAITSGSEVGPNESELREELAWAEEPERDGGDAVPVEPSEDARYADARVESLVRVCELRAERIYHRYRSRRRREIVKAVLSWVAIFLPAGAACLPASFSPQYAYGVSPLCARGGAGLVGPRIVRARIRQAMRADTDALARITERLYALRTYVGDRRFRDWSDDEQAEFDHAAQEIEPLCHVD